MTSVLDRGLRALDVLAERGEARLVELAEALETSRATAFRVLTTLQQRGYVEHSRTGHVYRLGPQIQALAAQSEAVSAVRLSAGAMSDLRAATGETVNLGLHRRGVIAYVAIYDGLHALRMSAKVGDLVPAHATGLGKAVLAWLPEEQRRALLGPSPYAVLTAKTITTKRALDAELESVVARGFALDDGEAEVGAVCVAAPLFGRFDQVIGAISVSGPAARLTSEECDRIAAMLCRHCAAISAALGFEPRGAQVVS